MTQTMTENEYLFLTDKWSGKDGKAYQSVGEECYENGWIDDFGLVTQKGAHELDRYEQKNGVIHND